ncbi:hypothetical protein [Streptomyces sp. NPDC021562]|uniref:hypothetical protein n=1 Tax=Streptomyces sp. NPDC021562 TaxID=3155121 RepID=UPI0033CF17FB
MDDEDGAISAEELLCGTHLEEQCCAIGCRANPAIKELRIEQGVIFSERVTVDGPCGLIAVSRKD